MEQQKFSKLKTYLGFATKSGSLQYGSDNISGRARLVIASSDLSEGSLSKLIQKCEKSRLNFKVLDSKVCDELFKTGVKVISIENSNLANAIYQLMEEI